MVNKPKQKGTAAETAVGRYAREHGFPLADRLKVDIGGTDPRTGQSTTTTTFKLTDKVHLVGALDQSGNYRGLFKFLVRFD